MRALSIPTVAMLLALASCTIRAPLPDPLTPLVPTPDAAFRRAPPANGPVPPFSPPEVHAEELANGMMLYVVERRDARLVAIRYVSRRAGSDDLPTAAGYGYLTADLIARRPALAELDARAFETFDSVGCELEVLPDEVDMAMARLAGAITRPKFNEAEVRLTRDMWRREAAPDLVGPWSLARVVATRWIHGSERASGRFADELIANFERFDQMRAQVTYARTFAPKDSAIVVVGNVDRERARIAALRGFASWEPNAPRHEPRPPAPPARRPTATVHALRQDGNVQAHVAFAFRAPARHSNDHAPFMLLAAIYGGLTTSRANMAVRESAGDSYGAYATFYAMRNDGRLILMTAVTPSQVVPILERLFLEHRRLRTRVITPHELETARANVREEWRAQFETTSGLADAIAELYVYGKPPEWWQEYDERLRRVTAGDVLRMAQRYFATGSPAIVVGDLDVAVRIERAGYNTVWGRDAVPTRK